MTIDEAVSKMKHLKYKVLQGAIIVHDTYSDDYELLDESALTALDMSIASLEAWKKVREEIVHLHDWAFDREEILRIIDRHLQEVADDLCRKEAD